MLDYIQSNIHGWLGNVTMCFTEIDAPESSSTYILLNMSPCWGLDIVSGMEMLMHNVHYEYTAVHMLIVRPYWVMDTDVYA
jgi:hypothetical protein